ncbi:MAG: hypothetical protein KF784_10200 [Fimbriimonadaceae bacterium]|nr:hypothetical protein [Fimbriimonadaceae bacterium]
MLSRISYPSIIGTTLAIAVVLFCCLIGVFQLLQPGINQWPTAASIALVVSIASSAIGLYRHSRRKPTQSQEDEPADFWTFLLAGVLTAIIMIFCRAGLETLAESMRRDTTMQTPWSDHIYFGIAMSAMMTFLYWLTDRRKSGRDHQGSPDERDRHL